MPETPCAKPPAGGAGKTFGEPSIAAPAGAAGGGGSAARSSSPARRTVTALSGPSAEAPSVLTNAGAPGT